MPKENDDNEPGLQQDSQPAAPTGEPPTLGPEPAREPTPPEAPPGGGTPDVGQPRALMPGPAACAGCGTEIPPGAGRCPTCGRFQQDNTESLVHGLRSKKLAKQVDAYRVDLIEQLFAERGGREALDMVSRIAIENYALVCAQHKTIEARLDQDGLFTQTGRRRSAFDMLKSISETIDRLRAQLPPVPTRTTTFPGVENMPLSALELARDLLTRLKAGLEAGRTASEVLSPFELGQLSVLHAAERGEVLLRGDLVPDDPPLVAIDEAPLPLTADLPVQAPARTVDPATAEPTCRYGCGSLARCAEIKASRPDAWQALHFNDPEEVKRRSDEATAVMLRQMGKPSPWL